MNTNYILEVLDEAMNQLFEIKDDNCFLKERFYDNRDYSGYGVCCALEERAIRISKLLKDIWGTIEEEDLRLYEIESQL